VRKENDKEGKRELITRPKGLGKKIRHRNAPECMGDGTKTCEEKGGRKKKKALQKRVFFPPKEGKHKRSCWGEIIFRLEDAD